MINCHASLAARPTPALTAELQQAAENALKFGLLRQKMDVRRAFDTSLDPVGTA